MSQRHIWQIFGDSFNFVKEQATRDVSEGLSAYDERSMFSMLQSSLKPLRALRLPACYVETDCKDYNLNAHLSSLTL